MKKLNRVLSFVLALMLISSTFIAPFAQDISSVNSDSGYTEDISVADTTDDSSDEASSEHENHEDEDYSNLSSTDDSDLDESIDTNGSEFTLLEIFEAPESVNADLGSTVKLSVTLNRKDIAVRYQWQKYYTAPSVDSASGEKEDEGFKEGGYQFLIMDMTEAELLEINPDATWQGSDLYFEALALANGDHTRISIPQGATSITDVSIDGLIINPDGTVTETEYGSVSDTWVNIEGANESTYTHIIDSSDNNTEYRCVITIIDPDYFAEYVKYEIGEEIVVDEIDIPDDATSVVVGDVVIPITLTTDAVRTTFDNGMPIENEAAASIATFNFLMRGAPSSVYLNGEWLCGVDKNMEYITESAYDKYSAGNANNAYWTKLGGGTRPDGSSYNSFTIVTNGGKIPILSAWYGETIYVRRSGTSGKGTAVQIPAFTGIDYQSGQKTLYKNVASTLIIRVPETGIDYYASYINSMVDGDFNLIGSANGAALVYKTAPLTPNGGQYTRCFNTDPDYYLMDAEGNYRYDSVMVGVCTYAEPDLSGKAAWALKAYVNEGYGFMTGHDIMYGYGGVTDASYVPDANSTVTPYYVLNTKINGHWNMNWLMGTNKLYTDASPYEAASLILATGDYRDKTGLYGQQHADATLNIATSISGNPLTDVSVRTPTNYPYSASRQGDAFNKGYQFVTKGTHSNLQIAYGTIWIDFASNELSEYGYGRLITHENDGLSGTNNFYLTTNGNYAMNQIGHEPNGQATYVEMQLFSNTVMYISQRQQCQVCQSEQGGNTEVHFTHRISSAEELANLNDDRMWFTYPKDGCYMLTNDIVLPENWVAINGFYGHFHADGHTVTLNSSGTPLFANNSGSLGQYTNSSNRGWNLGTDSTRGINSVVNNNGERTTGVARVSGYLNSLFGTGTGSDWAGYTVQVIGSDGVIYNCVTNVDGKYVISNVPTTGVMSAKVYKPNGTEVTEYGPIRVNVPQSFWNTDETTPLYLISFVGKPIKNTTVYESETAYMLEGGVYWQTEVTDITWQFKINGSTGWQNVEGNTLFNYEIGTPVFHEDGEDSWTEVSLAIKNSQLNWSGYEFRAVFKQANGRTTNTYDFRYAGYSGKLTVLPRPAVVTQAENKTVWVGEGTTFVSTIDFWRTPSQGLQVKWQYKATGTSAWVDITPDHPRFKVQPTTVTATDQSDTSLYVNKMTTTLKVNDAEAVYDGYMFQAVYTYTNGSSEQMWQSSTYNNSAQKREGLLSVRLAEIKVEIQPATSHFTTGYQQGNVGSYAYDQQVGLTYPTSISSETATYTALIYYAPDSMVVTPQWQYMNIANGYTFHNWNQAQATLLYPGSGITTKVKNTPKGVQVGGPYDGYTVIESVMTIKNIPSEMDFGPVRHYFQCYAEGTVGARTFFNSSKKASLEVVYSIDIKHNQAVITNGSGYADFTYPELDVTAPNGLRTAMVQFTSENFHVSDAVMTSALAAHPEFKVLSGNQYGYIFVTVDGSLVSEARWESFLRSFTWRTYDPQSAGGADIMWYIDEELVPGNTFYNSSTGHFYRFVYSGAITWNQAYTQANSTYMLGNQGYLVSITSAEEDNMVAKMVGATYAWTGGERKNGSATEWHWNGGPADPDLGRTFDSNNGVNASYGIYSNWQDGQPDYTAGVEDKLEIWTGQKWNDAASDMSVSGTTVTGYVIEFGGSTAALQRSGHSAFDTDNIGTGGGTFRVTITASDKIYDGKETVGNVNIEIVSGSLTQADLNAIRSYAKVRYSNGSVTNINAAGSGTLHNGAYTAQVTFSGLPSKYIMASNSVTTCNYNIFQRVVIANSKGNNKVYDGNNYANVTGITLEARTATTGIIASEAGTVYLTSTSVLGTYPDKNQTNGVEVPIAVRSGVSFGLVNNVYNDYQLVTNFSGQITPRPLTVHSLYQDPGDTTNNPRNIKMYDGTTDAVIDDILIDNIVYGDAVWVNQETYAGLFADKNAGESLNANGTTLPDRYNNLLEKTITRTESMTLVNNDAGNYYIAKEDYSGAIYRKTVASQVASKSVMYGEGLTLNLQTNGTYTHDDIGLSSDLTIVEMVPGDTLTINDSLSGFVANHTIDNTTPAGAYELGYEGLNETNYPVLSNYIVMNEGGNIIVYARPLEIRVNGGYTKTYGDDNPAFDVVINGWADNGDNVANSLGGTLRFTTPCTKTSDVLYNQDGTLGAYPVEADGLYCLTNINGWENYEITYVAGDITVTPLEITVEAIDKIKTYGNSDPHFNYILSTTRVKESDLNFSLTRVQGEDVGVYDIIFNELTLSASDRGNYTITYIPAELTIRPRTLVISASDYTRPYGQENPTFKIVYTGFANGDTKETALEGTLTVTCTATQFSPVGDYAIVLADEQVKPNSKNLYNYDIAYVDGSINITPLPITIIADTLIKYVGEDDPELTWTLAPGSELAGSDTLDDIVLARVPGEATGSYDIYSDKAELDATHSTDCAHTIQEQNPNYAITYVPGELIILDANRSDLVIKVSDETMIYGENEPAYKLEWYIDQNGDVQQIPEGFNIASISALGITGSPVFDAAGTHHRDVGVYAISASGYTLSPTSPFENIVYVKGNLTVTPRPIVITPDNKTKVYGENDPTLTYALTDTITGITYPDGTDPAARIKPGDLNGTLGRQPGENVGVYDITAGTLGDDPNYIITLEKGELEITPAELIITVWNHAVTNGEFTKVYGDENPEFDVKGDGFKNGDTFDDLDGEASYHTTATRTSNVGQYPVTVDGFISNNYNITYEPGVLNIVPKQVIIKIDNKTKEYGETDPVFTWTPVSDITGLNPIDVTITRVSGEDVGNYKIDGTVDPASNPNYQVTVMPGILTITKAKLIVKADDKTRMYGDPNPAWTSTIYGFKGTDNDSVLSGDIVYEVKEADGTTDVSITTNVGQYPIIISNASTLTADNYEIVYEDGTLDITKRPIDLTPGNPDTPVDEVRNIAVEKSADKATAKVGDTITYKVVVTNTGTVELTNVPVKDVNDGVGAITAQNGQGYTFDGVDTFVINRLPASKSITITYTYVVQAGDAGNIVNNVAIATIPEVPAVPEVPGDPTDPTDPGTPGKPGEPAVDVPSNEVDVPIDKEPEDGSRDISITKSVTQSTAKVGETLTYTISVMNIGNAPLEGVIVKDNFTGAGEITVVPSADYEYLGNGEFKITKTLDLKDTVNIVYTYVVQADDEGTTIHNVAVAIIPGDPTDPTDPGKEVPSNEVDVPVDGDKYAMTVEKQADIAFAKVGDVITYTVVVTNTGNKTLNGVTITDNTNGAGTIDAADGAGYTYDGNGKFTLDAFAPGEKVVLTYTYTVLEADKGKTVTNVAVGLIPSDKNDPSKPDVEVPSNEVEVPVDKDKQPITIIPDPYIKVYGDEDPELTYKISEPLVKPDDIWGNVVREPGENVGEYVINQGSVDSDNYEINFIPGEFTIIPAPLVITAKDASRPVGKPNPAFSATYSGFKFNDGPSDLGGALQLDTTATEASPVGTYPIVPSGHTSSNYDITYVNGTLTIYDCILINKYANVASLEVGETVTYTVVVKNTANYDMTDVIVTDRFDGAGEISAASTDVYTYEGNGVFKILSLKKGESVTITYTYTALAEDEGKTITNVAVVKVPGDPSIPGDPDKEIPSEEIEIPVGGDALTIVKSANKTAAKVGDTIIYTIAVTNTSEEKLENVTVKDTNSGLGGLVPEASSEYTYEGGSKFLLPEINPGQTIKITYKYVVADADAGTTVVNVAVATTPAVPAVPGDPSNPDDPGKPAIPEREYPSNEVEVPILDKNAPDVLVVKTADKTVAKVGETITYTVKVTNVGNVAFTNLEVEDRMNGAGAIEAANGTGYTYKGNGKFMIHSLDVGETITITYTYKVVAGDAGKTVKNTAIAKVPTDPTDPNSPTEEVPSKEVEVPVPGTGRGVHVAKSASHSTAKVGDTITYKIVVTNTGDEKLDNIQVVDNFNGAGSISVQGSTRYVFNNKNTFTIDTLAVGESVTITYTYKVVSADAGKVLKNTAVAKVPADPNDPSKPAIEVPSKEVEVPVVKSPGTVTTNPSTGAGFFTSVWWIIALIGVIATIGLGSVAYLLRRKKYHN